MRRARWAVPTTPCLACPGEEGLLTRGRDAQPGTESGGSRPPCPPLALHLAHLGSRWTWRRATVPQLQPGSPGRVRAGLRGGVRDQQLRGPWPPGQVPAVPAGAHGVPATASYKPAQCIPSLRFLWPLQPEVLHCHPERGVSPLTSKASFLPLPSPALRSAGPSCAPFPALPPHSDCRSSGWLALRPLSTCVSLSHPEFHGPDGFPPVPSGMARGPSSEGRPWAAGAVPRAEGRCSLWAGSAETGCPLVSSPRATNWPYSPGRARASTARASPPPTGPSMPQSVGALGQQVWAGELPPGGQGRTPQPGQAP